MVLYPINVGSARFRCGVWRGNSHIAYLVPLSPASTLDPVALSATRARLVADGFTEIITGAVGTGECTAMHRDGFTDREHLHLLRHDLGKPIPRRRRQEPQLSKGRDADHQDLLEIDRLAFDSFWQLDETGLQEALTATPTSRLRVVREEGIIAYAITGRAGSHGYLQRLAVTPQHEGRGLGTVLIQDSLRWLKRHHVDHVWVNTQQTNERALDLYHRLGFESETTHLTVLQRQLL